MVGAVYLHFTKAFDIVSHTVFVWKLRKKRLDS